MLPRDVQAAGSPTRPARAPAAGAGSPAKRPRLEGAGAGAADGQPIATGGSLATSASSAAAAAAEPELAKACLDLRQRVKELQAAEAEGRASPEGMAALAALLRRLAKLPVDPGTLRRTGAGREVNQPWIRKHPDDGIRLPSQALIHRWKAVTGVEGSGLKVAPAPTGMPDPQDKQAIIAGQPKVEKAPATTKLPAAPAAGRKAGAKAGSKRQAMPKDNDAPPQGGANRALSEAFAELSRFEFKLKETFKGVAYRKVANTLAGMQEEVKSVDQVKGVAGIGKASTAKIAQFLGKGSIDTLERYRRGEFGGPDD